MKPRLRRWSIVVGIQLVVLTGLYLALSRPLEAAFRDLFEDHVVSYMLTHATEEDKARYYEIVARDLPGIWEAVPEPDVARVLQRNTRKTFKQAEMAGNNAGMRSSRAYVPKAEHYRIVVLGDSVATGIAGREEDRIGDQIEEILTELEVRVEGKPVEVYTLAIGSWTAINEARYLTSRLSAYEPDLVLVLMVANDIGGAALGVTGTGLASSEFSPEFRGDGSGVFFLNWPARFGLVRSSLLRDGLGAECLAAWSKAFQAWKRLETLVEETGGRMLFAVLEANDRFVSLAKHHHATSGMTCPLIVTDYFRKENGLPHDPHPSRAGHRIMALHFLHVLVQLGWIPDVSDRLPPLDGRLSTETSHPVTAETLEATRLKWIDAFLGESLAFDALEEGASIAILGGIYPADSDAPLAGAPYGSVRCGFLLRRRQGASRLVLEIETPPFVELYPFGLRVQVNGREVGSLSLERRSEAGRHRLEAPLPATDEFDPALEVVLETDSYWTTIEDPTMKSYRLISARQE